MNHPFNHWCAVVRFFSLHVPTTTTTTTKTTCTFS